MLAKFRGRNKKIVGKCPMKQNTIFSLGFNCPPTSTERRKTKDRSRSVSVLRSHGAGHWRGGGGPRSKHESDVWQCCAILGEDACAVTHQTASNIAYMSGQESVSLTSSSSRCCAGGRPSSATRPRGAHRHRAQRADVRTGGHGGVYLRTKYLHNINTVSTSTQYHNYR